MPESELPEIEIDDQIGAAPRLGAARSSVKKARSSEMMAVWGVLGMLAIAGAGYAVREALRDEPPAPEPVVKVAPDPEPVVAPPAPKRRIATLRRIVEDREEQPPVVVERVVERVVETPKKAVDPLEGFDNGQAFDNPPSPGRYGRRSSGIIPSPQ